MGWDGSVLGRVAASTRRLAAPRALRASSTSSSRVILKWHAPKGAKPAHYLVLRDGKRVGKVTRATYTDRKVVAGRTYRYAVRAVDKRGKSGALSASVRVKVPKAPTATNNPVPPIAAVTPAPVAAPAPAPIPPEQLPLTQ